MTPYAEDVLDDPARLAAGDPQDMLPAVASAGAYLREAAVLAEEAGVAAFAGEGRPRAVVTCGMGGSGIAGDVLAAVAGPDSPVPFVAHRAAGLPAWVGAADLVVAVSCSGGTGETLSALEEAVRRGCPLLAVGAPDSPLAELAARGRAVFVPVRGGRAPRAALWSLAVPGVLAAHALGLLTAPPQALAAAADRLDQLALACGPEVDRLVNPAKRLAMHLSGGLPVVWGGSALAGVAAYRFACQLNENAKVPAVWGVLPEAAHNQVVALDGPFAGAAGGPALRLVLLGDSAAPASLCATAEGVEQLARQAGVAPEVLAATGESSLERLASLVGVLDWASAYLALLEGRDPTPVPAIDRLKQQGHR